MSLLSDARDVQLFSFENIHIHRQVMYGKLSINIKNVDKWCGKCTADRTKLYEVRSNNEQIFDETAGKVVQIMCQYGVSEDILRIGPTNAHSSIVGLKGILGSQ